MATLTLGQGAASKGREMFTATAQDSAVGGRIEPASVSDCGAESCQWQRGCYPTATGAACPLTEDRLWRPEKAAWYLDVKTSWVYEAVRTGRLPCHRVGRHIRFTRHMLDNWLVEQAKI